VIVLLICPWSIKLSDTCSVAIEGGSVPSITKIARRAKSGIVLLSFALMVMHPEVIVYPERIG
jgi:hypothetical protein